MQCRESKGNTDYIYYPIEFNSAVFCNVLECRVEPIGNYNTWAITIDKSKVKTGAGPNVDGYFGDQKLYTLLSIGI